MFDRALGKLLIVAVLAFGMSGTSAYGILALFSIEDTPVAPNDPNGGPFKNDIGRDNRKFVDSPKFKDSAFIY